MEMDVMHSIQQVKEIHLAIISLTKRMVSTGCFFLVSSQIVELLKESEAIYTVIARW